MLNQKGNGLITWMFGSFFTFFIIILLSGPIISTFCWPYSINTWLIYCHKSATITWWQGALIGLVPGLGQLSLIVAVATWVAMLFVK